MADTKYLLEGLNLRYSSWTNRAVLLLEHFEIPYDIKIHELGNKEAWAKTKTTLPAGIVPVLRVPTLKHPVHDSLAIAEYLHESHPSKNIWPAHKGLRAYGRSITAEMHSGFTAIRNEHPMNICHIYSPPPKISEAVIKDVKRILEIIDSARTYTKAVLQEEGGEDEGYLLGGFSVADSFYWPLLTRIHSYGIDTSSGSKLAKEYIEKMWSDKYIKNIGRKQLEELGRESSAIPWYDNVCEGSEMKRWDFEGWLNKA